MSYKHSKSKAVEMQERKKGGGLLNVLQEGSLYYSEEIFTN